MQDNRQQTRAEIDTEFLSTRRKDIVSLQLIEKCYIYID